MISFWVRSYITYLFKKEEALKKNNNKIVLTRHKRSWLGIWILSPHDNFSWTTQIQRYYSFLVKPRQDIYILTCLLFNVSNILFTSSHALSPSIFCHPVFNKFQAKLEDWHLRPLTKHSGLFFWWNFFFIFKHFISIGKQLQ